MYYLRTCYDKPGVGAARNEFRAEHREYLKPFAQEGRPVRIILAGPMCTSDADDTNLGSFMILEAASHDEIWNFHQGDPFVLRELFGRVEIVRWDRHIG